MATAAVHTTAQSRGSALPHQSSFLEKQGTGSDSKPAGRYALNQEKAFFVNQSFRLFYFFIILPENNGMNVNITVQNVQLKLLAMSKNRLSMLLFPISDKLPAETILI